MLRRLVLLLALSTASCVAPQAYQAPRPAVRFTPWVAQSAALDPSLGYVAGRFSANGRVFAFRVSSREGPAYHLAFNDSTLGGIGSSTRMIALPPGVYRVDAWLTSWHGRFRAEEYEVPADRPLARWFVVRRGHVVFLGSFQADTKLRASADIAEYTILPQRIAADEVPEAIRVAYPRFDEALLECLLCSEPKGLEKLYARPALTPEDAAARGIRIPRNASPQAPSEAATVPAKSVAPKSAGDATGPSAGAGGWWAPGSSQKTD